MLCSRCQRAHLPELDRPVEDGLLVHALPQQLHQLGAALTTQAGHQQGSLLPRSGRHSLPQVPGQSRRLWVTTVAGFICHAQQPVGASSALGVADLRS